jgi:hypothetical protein
MVQEDHGPIGRGLEMAIVRLQGEGLIIHAGVSRIVARAPRPIAFRFLAEEGLPEGRFSFPNIR